MAKIFREVIGHMESRDIRPLPYRVFPVSCASEAFDHMARARQIGKVVLSLQDPDVTVAPAAKTSFRSDARPTSSPVAWAGSGLVTAAGLLVSRGGARHLVLVGRTGYDL